MGLRTPEDLADRLRGALARRKGVSEKKMFGGTCFLMRDNMLCAASKRGLLFRVGKEAHAAAVKRKGAKTMVMNGRQMRGYVRVDPRAVDARALRSWLALAESYVATLPPKRK